MGHLFGVQASARAPLFLITAAVAMSVAACMCSIERKRGADIDARIVSSDWRGVVIEDGNGRRRRVPGEQISDIDHPGNVLMLIGAILGVSALAAMDSGESQQTAWRRRAQPSSGSASRLAERSPISV